MIEKDLYPIEFEFNPDNLFYHNWIFISIEGEETTMVHRHSPDDGMFHHQDDDIGWVIYTSTSGLMKRYAVSTEEELADKISANFSCEDAIDKFEAMLKEAGIKYDKVRFRHTMTLYED